jgi:signal transduction histidine kinase
VPESRAVNSSLRDSRRDLDLAHIESLVRAQGIRALYDRNGVAQATVLLNSAIVALVFWGHGHPTRLLLWVVALWIIAAGRLLLAGWYRRSERAPEEAPRWGRIFTAGAALNGIVWGVSPLLFHESVSLAHLIFLAFVLGGMAAGGALSNATHQPAFLAFTIPALLPITAGLLAGGDRLRVSMGLMLTIFGVAVSAISRSGARALAEAERLRFRNAELAQTLSKFNSELEARLLDRTRQFEVALSRQKDSELQLARSARLAGLATLAAGVAHEMNNPLAYLKSNLSFVQEKLALGTLDAGVRAALIDALSDAAEGVERVARVVRHLTGLARAEVRDHPESVEIHDVLDVSLEKSADVIRSRAALVRDYGHVSPVAGDRTQLEQVFSNLLLNAAQAIPEGDPAAHRIQVSTRREPGSGLVIVEVTDTGCGIPEASLDRIWEPFYTTKAVGQGTGLGLSISRSIVVSLGGSISVRSKEGGGSTFTVRLRTSEGENS